VTLLALYQQRIYRLLGREPRLARRVVARLPAPVGSHARDTIGARRALSRLTPPTTRRLRTGPALPAGRLRRYYEQAQRRFGVKWQMLAAVNFVESAFGRVRSSSSAGAQGPMQFLPATWRAYGLGGNVHDPHDAILGAANYLRANGAPRRAWQALYRYNPSPLYVEAVLRYTRAMTRDPRAYYAYYSWQVFQRTPSGDRRLTGPG
jgi:membrane-bound lytic murein transglycosylase B